MECQISGNAELERAEAEDNIPNFIMVVGVWSIWIEGAWTESHLAAAMFTTSTLDLDPGKVGAARQTRQRDSQAAGLANSLALT